MMPKQLRLISHKLCPYVQRAVIVATERGIDFERADIDLANKPDWFLSISPTGKVPVLEITDKEERHILFESAVIAEYLDEIGSGTRLLPADPLLRARERAWVEFASQILADIYRFYSAPDETGFEAVRAQIEQRLSQLEQEVVGPWFSGGRFGLVDAAFGPVFRYFAVFERRAGVDLLERHPKLLGWANALSKRPSVIAAVGTDYPDRLADFILSKDSHLARLLAKNLLEAA